MDASGENVYGAKKIGNTWYYFDEKTGAMHTGWRDAGEKTVSYTHLDVYKRQDVHTGRCSYLHAAGTDQGRSHRCCKIHR